eukprot:1992624-Rhodomonas_salina.1
MQTLTVLDIREGHTVRKLSGTLGSNMEWRQDRCLFLMGATDDGSNRTRACCVGVRRGLLPLACPVSHLGVAWCRTCGYLCARLTRGWVGAVPQGD